MAHVLQLGADTDGNRNFIVLLVDSTHLVAMQATPGRDVVDNAGVGTQYLQ
jgi:hypothetical protein